MTGLASVLTCLVAALLVPARPALDRPVEPAAARGEADWLRRWRPMWVLLAGVAAAVFVGGSVGLVAAPLAAAATWLVIERSEPAGLRRDRDLARHDLPHLVGLLADSLRSGQAPVEALSVVAGALPGPASARLAEVVPRLRLGLDPMQVWSDLAARL